MDCSLPGSSVHGILQARILRQFSSTGDLPDPEIEEPGSPVSHEDSLYLNTREAPFIYSLSKRKGYMAVLDLSIK